MIKNYFKIAWRNLLHSKLFSVINILGLSIGMTCAIFILLWVKHELSYDTYNTKADRIYRVTREFLNTDGSANLHLAAIAPPFFPLIKTDFPEIEAITRFIQDDNSVFKYNDKSFTENRVLWAEDNLFDVFDFAFISGNSKTALKEPNSIVITESTARKYFGTKNPLNATILYGEHQRPMKITGIVKDVPDNSHFHFDFLISFTTLKDLFPPDMLTGWWGFNNFDTYIVLPKNVSKEHVEARFPSFLDKHLPIDNTGLKSSKTNRLHLQPLTSIHLYSHLNSEIEPTGNITYVYLFLAIAFFIILIACINFINLSTARSTIRAKEVGIRKTVGASRKQLIGQFLCESILMAVIALIISLSALMILLPYFEDFTHKSYTVVFQQAGLVITGVAGLLLLVGIISGSYPAFYLSSFKPSKVIKGTFSKTGFQFVFRRVLVISQFAISAILIVAVAGVLEQLKYVQQKDLGLNKDNVVILPVNDSLANHYSAVKDILLTNPEIISATIASRIPSGQLLDAQNWSAEINGEIKQMGFRLPYSRVDYDYLKTFGIPVVAGRDFSTQYGTDTSGAFIINETAVKTIGWKSAGDAINKQLVYGDRKGKVIGVVKDFNFESLHNSITPLLFLIPANPENAYRNFIVRIKPVNIPGTLASLQNTWKQFAPKMEFDYSFLDERFNSLYQSELKLSKIFEWFAGIAIFIACLGLLGLSSFATEQRTKEIGIRKVLGASISGIISLLSKDFLKLVLLANLIAGPLTYYGMHKWLTNFAYHTSISWWLFAFAALASLLVALITVGFQAIKAAIANPVKSLRTE